LGIILDILNDVFFGAREGSRRKMGCEVRLSSVSKIKENAEFPSSSSQDCHKHFKYYCLTYEQAYHGFEQRYVVQRAMQQVHMCLSTSAFAV